MRNKTFKNELNHKYKLSYNIEYKFHELSLL